MDSLWSMFKVVWSHGFVDGGLLGWNNFDVDCWNIPVGQSGTIKQVLVLRRCRWWDARRTCGMPSWTWDILTNLSSARPRRRRRRVPDDPLVTHLSTDYKRRFCVVVFA